MDYNTSKDWNEMWQEMDASHFASGPDNILVERVKDLPKGCVLEIGCGTGQNAVWLSEQGWDVTAVDFSEVAIEKAKDLAKGRGMDVNFVVADASEYQPKGKYDLVTSFYIQLHPDKRAKMLSMAAKSLAHKGTLLFVSHDETSSADQWSEEDRLTLTTPDQIAAELPTLKIQEACVVKDEGGAHTEHIDESDHEHGSFDFSCTVVRAVKTG